MVGEPQINMVGNLVADPELRFTPSGVAAASVRIAVTPRMRDNSTGEWKDGETVWLSGTVWRQYAENVAESLTKGTRVIVIGRLKQRSYETREGEKRTVYEVEIDDIGPALRYATAKIQKASRSAGPPAATTTQTGPRDPWGGAVDEPPF
jgi:single-strand DNA-binding protein